MQALPVTSIFASIFAIIFVLMSLNVIRNREEQNTIIGDNNNENFKRAIRAHGNFAEYVPFFLILSALNELAHINFLMLYILGFIMLYGRVSHAYGLLVYEPTNPMPNALRFRKTGMMATFAAIALSAIILLMRVLY